jgi:hypothetical protein
LKLFIEGDERLSVTHVAIIKEVKFSTEYVPFQPIVFASSIFCVYQFRTSIVFGIPNDMTVMFSISLIFFVVLAMSAWMREQNNLYHILVEQRLVR